MRDLSYSADVKTTPRTGKSVISRATSLVGTPRTKQKSITSRTAIANNTPSRKNTPQTVRSGVIPKQNATRAATLKPRVATSENNTKTDIETLLTTMDTRSKMTEFCKTKYAECMDNFCNILDENQGRCSCSKNLKNYENTEAALKKASEELQDVAEQIQYIGLTATEIDTLFSQTEAEMTMSNTSDNSQLKNSLDKVKNLIVDIKPGTTTASNTPTNLSIDLSGLLDFSFNSSGFGLETLFGTQSADTVSISNQRGEQLYKTAAARCKKDVLDQCAKQNIDTAIITNSYDITIDRACIAYEQSLKESNTEMLQTVRNAQNVLQRARLMVAQQKNSYDLRGCVNELDSCMTDDYVCGADYEKCLDPTGKYIVDGAIVIGSEPGRIGTTTASGLWATWNYDDTNAWGTGNINEYLNEYLTNTFPETNLSYMANYLHNKIGRITDDGRTQGMCAAVFNRCRDYTYTNSKDGKYIVNNRVIREWLERTLKKIKAAQDNLLANYAKSCISNIQSCLSENNFDEDDTTKSKAAINACRTQILTCKSVNDDLNDTNISALIDWINKVIGTGSNNSGTGNSGSGDNSGDSGNTGGSGSDGSSGDSGNTGTGGSGSGDSSDNGGNTGTDNSGSGDSSGNGGNTGNSGSGDNSGNSGNEGGSETETQTITVKYDTNGGTPASIPDATCTVEGTLTLPNEPTRDGYIFHRWCYPDYNTINNAPITKCTEANKNISCSGIHDNTTITARWEAKTIKLVYYTDGGSNVPDGTCQLWTNFTMPTAPTREGYTFVDWYDNNTGKHINAGAEISCWFENSMDYANPRDEIVFRAVWRNNTTGKETVTDVTAGIQYCLDTNANLIDCTYMPESDIVVKIKTAQTPCVYSSSGILTPDCKIENATISYNGTELQEYLPMAVNYQQEYAHSCSSLQGRPEEELNATNYCVESKLPDLNAFLSNVTHSANYKFKAICNDFSCHGNKDIKYYYLDGTPKNLVHSAKDAQNGTIWYMIWQNDNNNYITKSFCDDGLSGCKNTPNNGIGPIDSFLSDSINQCLIPKEEETKYQLSFVKTIGPLDMHLTNGNMLVHEQCHYIYKQSDLHCLLFDYNPGTNNKLATGLGPGGVLVPCDLNNYSYMGDIYMANCQGTGDTKRMARAYWHNDGNIDLSKYVEYCKKFHNQTLKGIYHRTTNEMYWDANGQPVKSLNDFSLNNDYMDMVWEE